MLTPFSKKFGGAEMRLIYLLPGVVYLILGQGVLVGQKTSSFAKGSDCGVGDDNVSAVANALGVCDDLNQLLHPSIPPEFAQPETPKFDELFTAPGTPRPGALRSDPGRRQRIDEALSRGEIESNLALLRLNNAMLQMQNSELEDEVRTFRRSKILNAFLVPAYREPARGCS